MPKQSNMPLLGQALKFRRQRILRLHKGPPRPTLKTKETINLCLLLSVELSGPHIWRCKRPSHMKIRLTGGWLDTGSVGFSRADGNQVSMSKKLHQQNPKNSKFGRRISCGGGSFLETRPKNKDALACKRDPALIGSMVAVNASICLQARMEF